MKKEWEIKKLGEICNKITDGSHNPPKGIEVSEFLMLSSKNIFDDSINYDNPRFLTEKDFNDENKRTDVNSNDVLLTIVGTIGRVAVVPHNHNKFTLQRSVAVLKPKSIVSPRFLMFGLQNKLDFLVNESRGVAQKGLYLNQLNNISIEIPPIPEQQRIVAILDEAFEAIDQAKANTEKNLQNAKELFQSELNSIFTNKGEGWVEKKLNQISENLDNKRIPITKNVRSSGKYPYYGASGIVDYVADYIFDDDLLLVSEDGANLLARTYPIAFPVSGKIWVNNHAHILKFKDLTTQRFVEFYLNSIRLDPFVSGMAQPKLNQAMLNKIPIPFPPLREQKRIVNQLDTLSAETKQLEQNYRKKLESLEELKKSILQKAFSGELTNKTYKITEQEQFDMVAEK